MSEELKPCPFCGSGDIEVYGDSMFECQGCGFIIDDVSVSEWNTRHIPEGYKLVPIDPSEAMRKAAWDQHYSNTEGALLLYKAMLEAVE